MISKENYMTILNASIRAPSAHNSQPWKISVKENKIYIEPELSRSLPIGDPDHRELWTSLGCFIQNLITAAETIGFEVEIRYDLPQIVVSILGDTSTNSTEQSLKNIYNRRTSRNPYTNKYPDAKFLSDINALPSTDLKLDVITNEEKKNRLADIALKADIEAFSSSLFREELSSYMHPIDSKNSTGLKVPRLIASLCKYVNLGKLAKRMNEKILKNHTPVFFLISTSKDSEKNWIEAGLLYEKIALLATEYGMVTGPWSAPILNVNCSKEIQKVIKTTMRPQIFSRLGYEENISPPTSRLTIKQLNVSL
jgi:hypothetical protein